MKEVTLYTVKEEKVMIHQGQDLLRYHSIRDLKPINYACDEFVDPNQFVEQVDIPIRKWVFTEPKGSNPPFDSAPDLYKREEYIAISEEAERLFNIEIDHIKGLSNQLDVFRNKYYKQKKIAENRINLINRLMDASLWTRIKWVFTSVN